MNKTGKSCCNFQVFFFLLILGVNGLLFTHVECDNNSLGSDDDLLGLTDAQKQALHTFKARVMPMLAEDYMKEDFYLIKWLQAKSFNVTQAEQFLSENLEWRRTNRMDMLSIVQDFPDLADDYPLVTDAVDKTGAPVIMASAEHWDLRRVHQAGQHSTIIRYAGKVMDEAYLKLREAHTEGNLRVTGVSLLLNLDEFNTGQHTCPPFCLQDIENLTHLFQEHYPERIAKVVVFNANPTLQVQVKNAVKEVVNERYRDKIKVFGTSKLAWRQYILDLIDEDQLPPEFGGTRAILYT